MRVDRAVDLLRVGVLLLGVVALIIATIGLLIYLERPRPAPAPPFYAYCIDKYVVVSTHATWATTICTS